jgi:dTDP-4-dehydrorhamnose reductase
MNLFICLQEITGDNCEVRGIPSSYPTPAKRPAFFLLLINPRLKNTYGVSVPDYKG